jgi:hypothetical protein
MVDTAIFLGAGASKTEGAPLQGQLFAEYFSSADFRRSRSKMDRELAAFFLEMFKLNVKRGNMADITFPTFEEVLGLTDLAIMRKEAFRHFDIENREQRNSGRLRLLSQYLVFLVAKVLDAKLPRRVGYHRKLVRNLVKADELRNVVFVSTNYDILIDNALTEEPEQGFDLDYGVEFRNFDPSWQGDNHWRRPALDNSVQLFKPHGSLNWLFCPTCSELEITPKEKGVVTRLISDFAKKECFRCGSVFSPLIVPPTFYKDLNNVFLSTIWNRTDVALQKVKHVIFCGYSFPDADIHIKYLLKRAQTNRSGVLTVTVINHFPDKDPELADQEKYRYERFLGTTVKYTKRSFEEFAADPFAVIEPAARP